MSSAKWRPFCLCLNVLNAMCDDVLAHCITGSCYRLWTGRILFNTLRLRQNGRHFPDNIFKCIFWDENVRISIDISIIFVPKGPINNIPSLAQTRPGAKPFSESMQWWLNLLTHIWVTRPWWVNSLNSGKCGTNFKSILFKLNIENGSLGTHLMNCDLTNATEPH